MFFLLFIKYWVWVDWVLGVWTGLWEKQVVGLINGIGLGCGVYVVLGSDGVGLKFKFFLGFILFVLGNGLWQLLF